MIGRAHLQCCNKQHRRNVAPKSLLRHEAFDGPSIATDVETTVVDDCSRRYALQMWNGRTMVLVTWTLRRAMWICRLIWIRSVLWMNRFIEKKIGKCWHRRQFYRWYPGCRWTWFPVHSILRDGTALVRVSECCRWRIFATFRYSNWCRTARTNWP